MAALTTHRGIGPWTAAVVALRGFGRLDLFPMNDSGVAKSVRDLSGERDVDVEALLARLGPQRGMLYYHLLLGRLAARGDVELAPTAARVVRPMANAIPCTHLDQIRPGASQQHARLRGMPETRRHVGPSADVLGMRQRGLLRFIQEQHATKHFHATKHPIMRSIQPGENWKWCFIDEVGWE